MEILKRRRSLDLCRQEARDLWVELDWCHIYDYTDINHVSDPASSIISEIIGDEWWYSIPEKPNPKYEYIRKIVETVKEGLSKLSENLAPV